MIMRQEQLEKKKNAKSLHCACISDQNVGGGWQGGIR